MARSLRIAALGRLTLVAPASARPASRHPHRSILVACDAEDKSYYSAGRARAHGLHDRL